MILLFFFLQSRTLFHDMTNLQKVSTSSCSRVQSSFPPAIEFLQVMNSVCNWKVLLWEITNKIYLIQNSIFTVRQLIVYNTILFYSFILQFSFTCKKCTDLQCVYIRQRVFCKFILTTQYTVIRKHLVNFKRRARTFNMFLAKRGHLHTDI